MRLALLGARRQVHVLLPLFGRWQLPNRARPWTDPRHLRPTTGSYIASDRDRPLPCEAGRWQPAGHRRLQRRAAAGAGRGDRTGPAWPGCTCQPRRQEAARSAHTRPTTDDSQRQGLYQPAAPARTRPDPPWTTRWGQVGGAARVLGCSVLASGRQQLGRPRQPGPAAAHQPPWGQHHHPLAHCCSRRLT